MWHRVSISFLALLITTVRLSAQAPASKGLDYTPDNTQAQTGKTYALIVGISKYQSSACYPSLHYADVDAREFYQYLISKTGGNVDTERVVLLLNDQATQTAIWKGFNSIKNRLKKNDVFYIYFSGHGDAISTDLVYLLAYNAPPGCEKNLYESDGGVINVHSLKSNIKLVTMDASNAATVILITDACRSNELPPGGEEGKKMLSEEMFTKTSGEIQFVSCLANQQSYEDARWGGGRGLFSWHLVNGLKGMADNDPEDGIVTPSELSTYVTSNVKKDSYDSVTHTSRQTPKYFCPDKNEGFVIAKVNKDAKEQLAAQLKVGSATSGTKAFAVNKGVNLGMEMKRQGYEELYKKFITAINEKRLIDPAENNAMSALQEILAANITPELKSDLKFELSGRLMDDVTAVINSYLHGTNNNNVYTYAYFNTAVRKLKAFQSISDTLYYNQKDITANLLFLEGHSKWLSNKSYELKECLAKADSAIALKPNAAYLVYLKGLIHLRLKEYKEAKAAYERAIALAPNWTYPYNDMGNLYGYIGEPQKGLPYLLKADAIDTNDQTLLGNTAVAYWRMGIYDSVFYYLRKGLKKDPTDFHLWTALGNLYLQQKNYDSALYNFYRAMHYDSTFFSSYEGALSAHLEMNKYNDSGAYYVRKMINAAPSDPVVYLDLGNIFSRYDLDTTAMQMYEYSIKYDSTNIPTWEAAAQLYAKMKQYKSAAACEAYAIMLDTAAANDLMYNQLGLYYNNTAEYPKALEAFAQAIYQKPDNEVYYYNYGFISVENNDPATAEKYFRKTLQLNPKYHSACYELSKILAARSEKEEALKMLGKAVELGEYYRKDIMNEEAFTPLKSEPQFMSLLLKAKQ